MTTNLQSQPTTLHQASHQWLSRPADERFLSLTDMQDHFLDLRAKSHQKVISSRKIEARPVEGVLPNGKEDRRSLVIMDDVGEPLKPSNWAFGQLAQRADAPPAYLRRLPSDLAADNLNYGFASKSVEEMGFLTVFNDPSSSLSAATGPNYGRVWNADVVEALIHRFGNGVDGDFVVPGEFGVQVKVNKQNTTLYAGERDMFVFLADEKHRIEMPNRRNGQPGSLARGFFLWNSEVGSTSLGIGTFLFDYACRNRIVWGAQGYDEIRIRHSSGAPDRFIEEVTPALLTYANSSTASVNSAIAAAQAATIEDNIEDFLANRRFSRNQAKAISLVHLAEEDRPIETVWDAVTAITAYAKGVENQDDRVALEREGGKLLSSASK
jgi:hypothetical protein